MPEIPHIHPGPETALPRRPWHILTVGQVSCSLRPGPGSEVQKPLATVVIGGLIASTLLTLWVLPTLYLWLEGRRNGPGGVDRRNEQATVGSFDRTGGRE